MTDLRTRFSWSAALAIALAAALPSCSKNPEPPPAPAPAPDRAAAPRPTGTGGAAAPMNAHPTDPAAPGAGEIAWDVPAGWETAPNPSAMRKATYKIKRAEGDPEDGDLSVTQVGGSVEQNVQRWVGQFDLKPGEEAKRTQRTVGDLKVTVVELGGTFKSGMPGMGPATPKDKWALLGAIVETPTGMPWFFKLTGPEKTVTGARADFDKLVDSFRLK